MITIRFESGDFDIRDLPAELQAHPLPDGVSISLKKSEEAKEGERPVIVDILEVVFKIDVTEEALKLALTSVLTVAFLKIKSIAFADPHILIRFNNGAKRKIPYDKGDSAIVEELLSYIHRGDVKSVAFKS